MSSKDTEEEPLAPPAPAGAPSLQSLEPLGEGAPEQLLAGFEEVLGHLLSISALAEAGTARGGERTLIVSLAGSLGRADPFYQRMRGLVHLQKDGDARTEPPAALAHLPQWWQTVEPKDGLRVDEDWLVSCALVLFLTALSCHLCQRESGEGVDKAVPIPPSLAQAVEHALETLVVFGLQTHLPADASTPLNHRLAGLSGNGLDSLGFVRRAEGIRRLVFLCNQLLALGVAGPLRAFIVDRALSDLFAALIRIGWGPTVKESHPPDSAPPLMSPAVPDHATPASVVAGVAPAWKNPLPLSDRKRAAAQAQRWLRTLAGCREVFQALFALQATQGPTAHWLRRTVQVFIARRLMISPGVEVLASLLLDLGQGPTALPSWQVVDQTADIIVRYPAQNKFTPEEFYKAIATQGRPGKGGRREKRTAATLRSSTPHGLCMLTDHTLPSSSAPFVHGPKLGSDTAPRHCLPGTTLGPQPGACAGNPRQAPSLGLLCVPDGRVPVHGPRWCWGWWRGGRRRRQ